MKVKNWLHARLRGLPRPIYYCECDVCRYEWPVLTRLPAMAVSSLLRHAVDYHGGVDRHD